MDIIQYSKTNQKLLCKRVINLTILGLNWGNNFQTKNWPLSKVVTSFFVFLDPQRTFCANETHLIHSKIMN